MTLLGPRKEFFFYRERDREVIRIVAVELRKKAHFYCSHGHENQGSSGTFHQHSLHYSYMTLDTVQLLLLLYYYHITHGTLGISVPLQVTMKKKARIRCSSSMWILKKL
jgi:hypothetical protein